MKIDKKEIDFSFIDNLLAVFLGFYFIDSYKNVLTEGQGNINFLFSLSFVIISGFILTNIRAIIVFGICFVVFIVISFVVKIFAPTLLIYSADPYFIMGFVFWGFLRGSIQLFWIAFNSE